MAPIWKFFFNFPISKWSIVNFELFKSLELIKYMIHVISQENLDKFFIWTNISVLKKTILLKFYFHLKDDKNYVGGLCIKIHFIYLSKR